VGWALPSPLLVVPLAVDGLAVTFGTADVTAHPSMASAPTSYYLMWHYNCLWTVDG